MDSIALLLLTVFAAVAVLFALIIKFKVEPFIALTVVSIVLGLVAGVPVLDQGKEHNGIVSVMTNGLGAAMGKIAALITLGAIFGEILRASGAMTVLGDRVLSIVGVKRGPLAMAVCGLVVGATMFFDPAVILLAPLTISVAKQSQKSLAYFAVPMSVAVLAMHATLPPHPGAVAIASVLNVSYGLLIMLSLVCVLPGFAAAFLYTQWIAKRVPFVAPQIGGSGPEGAVAAESSESQACAKAPAAADGPGVGTTVFVLLLPIVLILLQTLTSGLSTSGPAGGLVTAVQFLGTPWIALTISCLVGAWLLLGRRGESRQMILATCEKGMRPVGQILMTAAGGAIFGSVIKASGIGPRLFEELHNTGLPIVLFGFLTTALLRATLGTTTAAAIAVATLIGPTVADAGLSGAQLALVAIGIAAGGMSLSHVNDAGFWVISRYFGMPVPTMIRTWTVAVTIMGVITAAIATALFYPLG